MNKTKSFLQVWVVALCVLFVMALTIGITAAGYKATRKADGTMNMGGGIVLDYSGFGKSSPDHWENETTTTFKLFTDTDVLPGSTINLNSASIKKGASSIDFHTRIKFEYKFYDALDADVTASILDYSAFLSTPTLNSAWVDGNAGDGWFYYATGTTLNALPASYVDIFTSSQSISIALNAGGFNHQGGGYKYSNEITITKVEALLTVETVQIAGSTWEIIPQYTDAASVVYTQNANGTWTLTDGTTLSGNSSSSTATYEARIYTSSYSYTVLSQINNQDVVAIGDNAFKNAVQLTSVEIPSTVTTIGANAFKGTGLTAITLPESVSAVGTNALATNTIATVTIENDQAVVTGIETAGIPTASTINVPGAVLNGYQETTLSSSGVTLLGVYPPSVGLTYEYDSTTQSYTVTGIGECTDTSIVIPETYDDGENGEHAVTRIGSYAFYDCSMLSSFSIPNTISFIGDSAFALCSNLSNINFVNGNQNLTIGNRAFAGCSSLETVTIPNRLYACDMSENYGLSDNGIFCDCISLTTVTFENNSRLVNLPSYMFNNCSSLATINFAANSDLRTIGDIPFRNCTNIVALTIPSYVTGINSWAFAECPNLTTIDFLGNSVQTIGERIATNSENLTTFHIVSGVTSIHENAFYGSNITTFIVDSQAALSNAYYWASWTGNTIYLLEGLTPSDYVIFNFVTTTSDKTGYVKYVKN